MKFVVFLFFALTSFAGVSLSTGVSTAVLQTSAKEGLTVSITQFKKSAETDYAIACKRAIRYLATRGGGTLVYPAGRFVQGPVELSSSGITVRGAGISKTYIVRNSIRGYAFWANNKKDVKVSNLSIDCSGSPLEGGVYFGGCTNAWGERVVVKNADATSFVLSSLLFNENGKQVTATGNGFRSCVASNQKRYHEVGGKSPFIAGDYARNSRFESCTVTNSVGDSYDSDNAPGTIFLNCVAQHTGGISQYTGFWSEGEQTDSDHKVTWINCRTSGFTNGFGVAERVKATIRTSSANNCVHAVRGINHMYRINVDGFVARVCGIGLKDIETDGVLSFTGPATLKNVKTINSLAKNSFCNFSGGQFTNEQTILGSGSVFDKDVYVSYENMGSRNIILSGVTLNNGYVRYYNATQTELLITNTSFNNGGINGARIKKSRITGRSRFKSTDNKGVAVVLNLDNFNTDIDNATFEGYSAVSNNARVSGKIRRQEAGAKKVVTIIP